MKFEKIFCIVTIIFLSISINAFTANNLSFDADGEYEMSYTNLGRCIIYLKNGNKIKGNVRMRFNFPQLGENFKDGKFNIQTGYNKKHVLLTNVKELRLAYIKWPYKGKIMLKLKNGKELPLKNFIVAREPIQLMTKNRGVLNLRFKVIVKIERE